MPIVPGTDFQMSEKSAGKKFTRKNKNGINAAPDHCGKSLEKAEKGRKEAGTSIDGEHPERSFSFEGKISPSQGVKRSKYNFQAPAGDAAS